MIRAELKPLCQVRLHVGHCRKHCISLKYSFNLEPKQQDLVFATQIPTKTRWSCCFISRCRSGFHCEGSWYFCTRVLRRSLRGALNLGLAHDDHGVLFREILVNTSAAALGLLAGSIELCVDQRCFVP